MIETITKRRKLKPRKTPYWHKISVGKYIGFYRTGDGGSWHARMLVNGQRYFHPIDGDINSDYEEMLQLAYTWFEQAIKLANPEKAKHTVKSVIEDYISYLRIEKSNDAAYRTDKQMEKHLLPVLGKTELKKLTTNQLKNWRDSLVKVDEDPEIIRKSKDSANRTLTMAKAAFNMAFNDGIVPSDVEWRRVKPFKMAGANRKLFLTAKQVTTLIKHADGGLKKLIQAGAYIGARPGELTAALTRDFDPGQRTLQVSGKTGDRIIYLSIEANKFFKSITKNSMPNALIFTQDDGSPWISNNYNRSFRKAVQASKLPSETVFYSLRHYHISIALKTGIQAQFLAENTGTSIRMLEKHYGKFMKQDRREMIDRVELGI